MPELIKLIREYGKAAYEAGIYEREEAAAEKQKVMDELFEQIKWLIED